MAKKLGKPRRLRKSDVEHLREDYCGVKYPEGLTREMAKDICQFIRNGGSPRAACVAVGISLAKFEKWYYRGELMSQKVDEITTLDMLPEVDAICYAFYMMVSRAVAKASIFCAAHLRRNGDWRAHAWRMDKIYHKFIDKDAPDHKQTGEDGKPIENGPKVIIYMPDNGRSTR